MKNRKENNMKRFVLLIYSMLFAILLCGCNDSHSTVENMTESSLADSIGSVEKERNSEPIKDQKPVQEERNGDFRSAFWGDDKETVKKYETTTYADESEETMLFYDAKVASKNAWIIYKFDTEGKLYQASYHIKEEHSNAAEYIQEFNSLKEALTAVYGTPTLDKKNKISSLADYAADDVALSLGYINFMAVWQTDRSDISLILMSFEGEPTTCITYTDLNHEDVVDTSGL